MGNIKIQVTDWKTNIAQCSKDNQAGKIGQLIKYSLRNIFLQKSCRKRGRETSCRPLFVF